MEPPTMTKEGFTVVGVKTRATTTSHNIPDLWQELSPRAGEIGHMVPGGAAYGICLSFDEATSEFEYVAGFEVERVADLPAGMGSWTVPEQVYARFSTTLPGIRETWRFINEEWLPESAYERVCAPDFEEYGAEFDPGVPDSKMYLYIPIRPRD